MSAELRNRMATASALATGAEGPGRVALDRLRRYGLGERVIKSALAAGLAWLIAEFIHEDPAPVLAPITAIFTIQLTLAQSLTGSAQRLLGVAAGVSMAIALSSVIGVDWWVISLIVLLSLFTGLRLFRLEPSGVEQMTVSALLVLVIGSTGDISGVAAFHVLDTVIGTGVGLAANSLIAPPSHVPNARNAVQHLGRRLIEVLDELGGGLAAGMDAELATRVLDDARAVSADLDDVQLLLDRAGESLRYNLPGIRQRSAYKRLQRANRALEHAAVQTRVISRTIADAIATAGPGAARPAWLEPDKLGVPVANLMSAMAMYLDHFLSLTEPGKIGPDDAYLRSSVIDRRREASNAASLILPELLPDRWVLVGEILSVSDQLLTDLSAAARDIATS